MTKKTIDLSTPKYLEWEENYYKVLIEMVKEYKPKKNSVQNWEAFWSIIIGYSVAHLAYMQRKYGREMKHCPKENIESMQAAFEKGLEGR